MKLKILIDSTSDISDKLAQSMDITIIPLNVMMGDTDIDFNLKRSEFFKLMRESKTFPKTSAPAPDVFLQKYKEFEDYDKILMLTLTSLNSATYKSACIGKELYIEQGGDTDKVYVYDTLNSAIAMVLFAKEAYNMAALGCDMEQIITRLEDLKYKAGLYVSVDTLEFLKRGGRMNTVNYAIGTLLNIKAIITNDKGNAVAYKKCKGIKKALYEMADTFVSKAKDTSELLISHSDALDRVADLIAIIEAKLGNQKVKINVCEMGHALSSHSGPRAVCIAFEEKFEHLAH